MRIIDITHNKDPMETEVTLEINTLIPSQPLIVITLKICDCEKILYIEEDEKEDASSSSEEDEEETSSSANTSEYYLYLFSIRHPISQSEYMMINDFKKHPLNHIPYEARKISSSIMEIEI